MEWKRVRSWLLLLLLAADLVLAGNIGWQLYQLRRSERQAMQDAVALVQQDGIVLSEELVRRMPESTEAYQIPRNSERELQAAQALLGAEEAQEPGGGVAIYQSEVGQLSFRRGGALELQMQWTEKTLSGERCRALLEEAGFPMEQAALTQENGTAVLLQQYEGKTVFNCRLQWGVQGETMQVRGRWLMSDARSAETRQQGMNRAQLVLALRTLLEQQGLKQVKGLEPGYILQSEDPQSVLLVPVWAIETENGQRLMSCLDGNELNY